MAKIKKDNPVDRLTNLLLQINQGGEPQALRKEANQIVSNLSPKDLITAQDRLIDYGLSHNLVQQLSSTFLLMGLFEMKKADPRHTIAPDHLVYQVTTEHGLLRCYMADLESIVAAIKSAETLSDTSSEYRRLAYIAQHLNAAQEHFEREKDVIFPTLAGHQYTTVCRELKTLQSDVQMAVSALINVTLNIKTIKLENFKTQLEDVSEYLIAAMIQLLNKEDRELYEPALKNVDTKIWKRLKWICDDIGYCILHG